MIGLTVQRTNIAGATRCERDGREWLVAPVVALVPGVLNGELVLADEIGRYTPVWNDSPVTIGHPHDGREYISARSLEALDAFACGRLYDVRFEDGRLKGDVWIDLDRLEQFGDAGDMVLSQIVDGGGCEVSTGYFRDVERANGAHEGRRYQTIARNIRPDHLALLPTAEGACNWADGCGVPRTNFRQEKSMTKPTSPMPAVNASVGQRLMAALADFFGITPDEAELEAVAELEAGDVVETNDERLATVALFLADESAAALALSPGDLPPGSIVLEPAGLSVPLLTYRGSDALQFLSSELAYVARSTAVMAAQITGFGRLITGEAMDVLYLTLGGQAIQRWAYDLGEYLGYFAYGGDEEEAPEIDVQAMHLILAYLPAGEATPAITPAGRAAFSHLGVTVGQDQIVFNLAGEMRTAPADPLAEAVNESAVTAERFITYADLTAMLTLAREAHPAPVTEAPVTDPPEEPEPVPAAFEAAADSADESQPPGEGVLAENGEDETMNDRRQLIEALLANADCQCERAVLEAMTLDDLKVMAADLGVTAAGDVLLMPGMESEVTAPVSNVTEVPVEAVAPAVPVETAVPAPVAVPAAQEAVAPAVAPVATNESELAELLTAVRQFGGVAGLIAALNNVQANAQAERASLIAALAANHRCAFTPDQLATFSTENLRLLENSLESVDFGGRPRPNGRVPAGGSMIVEIPMPAL